MQIHADRINSTNLSFYQYCRIEQSKAEEKSAKIFFLFFIFLKRLQHQETLALFSNEINFILFQDLHTIKEFIIMTMISSVSVTFAFSSHTAKPNNFL